MASITDLVYLICDYPDLNVIQPVQVDKITFDRGIHYFIFINLTFDLHNTHFYVCIFQLCAHCRVLSSVPKSLVFL